jgi:hypothetical protein
MDERIEVRARACHVERPHERRRMRPHDGEQRLYRLEDTGDTSERERRRPEADHFTIVRRGVAPDDVHGIGCGVRVIERPVEIVEPTLEMV